MEAQIREGQLIGYIRVSTADQNIDRQRCQLSQFNLDELFIDHASGKDFDRPQLQAAIKYLRKGDTLIVCSMDRLARNLDHLRSLVKSLTDKKVTIQFLKENVSFTGDESPMSNLLLSIMGAFAEFERSLIKERQKEGIAIAKARGVYKGRKPSLTDQSLIELKECIENGVTNKSKLAKEFGVTRQTIYNYILRIERINQQ